MSGHTAQLLQGHSDILSRI